MYMILKLVPTGITTCNYRALGFILLVPKFMMYINYGGSSEERCPHRLYYRVLGLNGYGRKHYVCNV